MGKTSTDIKVTYEDYRNAPESERERYELVEGEVVMVPSPNEYHQRIVRNLAFLLHQYITQHALGSLYWAPFDVILSEDTVLQPDILFVGKERSDAIAEEGIRGAPDLVVEVLSPATAKRDRTYKKALYARYGVKEYWLVDPATKSIELLTLGEHGFSQVARYVCAERDILESPSLAGLSIDLDKVF